ncbi:MULTISPECIES: hypothetical protein [unclassified Pseudoalteromonas]|jgi:hypothetical protein|uniref:hypothetical protein n=1 Tax=unclassified Pseudoalteromonas TaxID=194690 RepID=UPI00073178A1|nr:MULTISPECIES: hypothetical protein [unclassified Pseudoalteromonas]KTD98586.1 hypothetical protein ATS71_10700 [Pseudoalteromonas sp. H71]MCK8135822.1 hypothetical protein [Pseudoalteromonas sp. 2CM28B]MDC9510683.1 hypothetical protein [Pseudoalteromonas sp. Angola-4]TMN78455.1 hypothetical protein CWB64_16335 [Pseudoalteromonas sp. S410]TMN87664.1 hypothetical protein CWB62_17945 [Pseudoalteromonas sp. S408]|tara:strand:+ start:92 stop:511 length:420 start_codon:yes stop_codon:yes gene_type:complete
MSNHDIKNEEKFMGQNAWFSLFMGVTLLIISVYPLLTQTSAPLLFFGTAAFLGSFCMFVIRGGFTWKMKYHLTYKDEYLNTIDTIAYKHVVLGLLFSMGGVYLFSDDLALEVSHTMMASFYLAVMCLIYGVSILWQSKD